MRVGFVFVLVEWLNPTQPKGIGDAFKTDATYRAFNTWLNPTQPKGIGEF